ncbi:MAG TPA: rhomboid family intramembrane serine protease [Gammaproteobacteria bacterium]|nr:rhomboid family intramembrane serine protease [Gammaproteobacteria bacterium]
MTVTLAIIIVTCAVSFACFQNPLLLQSLLFWPPGVTRGEPYRLVTHGFVHADGQHLLFNMITLYFFGRAIEPFFERYIGPVGFGLFYLGGIVAAILPSYIQHYRDSRYRSLGASGAVSAVLFTFILLSPWSLIYVFFLPVPAILYAAVYTAYSFYGAQRGGDNINHSAHLWGAAYGVVFALIMEPRLWANFINRLLAPLFGG